MPPSTDGAVKDDGNEPPALLAELQRALENFEQVPVVNFGWVALFILIYILIVGPLDYILLTRVFKRPELTWITFPLVIVGLSVLIYCVAFAMKGDDLRINKIDLVEYDLTGPQQAYGTTWFTLFSPRIQNYTVGAEPSAPGWAAGAACTTPYRIRSKSRLWPTPTWRSASARPACFVSPTPMPRTPPGWSACRFRSGPRALFRRHGAPASIRPSRRSAASLRRDPAEQDQAGRYRSPINCRWNCRA